MTTTAPPFHPTPGALIGGKYRLESPLARGGMGAVWVARHVDLGTTVAVKFMDATFAASPNLRKRIPYTPIVISRPARHMSPAAPADVGDKPRQARAETPESHAQERGARPHALGAHAERLVSRAH